LATIFPWVEQEQLQLQLREKENRFAKDIALMHFLRLMVYFRTVLIQDFAILFTKHPTCPILKFPPFNSPCFREFAVQSSARITAVEQQSKLALANLPRHVAETFRGAVSNLSLDQKRERDQTREVMQSMEQKIGLLSSLLQQNKHGRNSRSQGELGMFIFSVSFQAAHFIIFSFQLFLPLFPRPLWFRPRQLTGEQFTHRHPRIAPSWLLPPC
jgi:hypothetical protein